jgi:hypothetical protein
MYEGAICRRPDQDDRQSITMLLIHSSEIPAAYLERLGALFADLVTISIPPSDGLYASIRSHPDIVLFTLDHKTFICSPSIFDALETPLMKAGARLVRSRAIPSGGYPDTAALNAVRVGSYIMHNTKCTDTVIRDLARKRGLELVHVNQGYTRCSVVPVAQHAIITSDPGIAHAAEGIGLDVLVISPDSVLLPGEKYGFIGGACGIAPDGRVIFLGDISLHPDYAAIDAFFRKHDVPYAGAPGLPLFDAGSLILLPS